MQDYFLWNGVDCRTYGIHVTEQPPMNDHMSGDFPVLKPGMNAISWSGNVTSVVISPRWRYL